MWLAPKQRSSSKEYIKKIKEAIKAMKGLSRHGYCEYDTLKEHGTFCHIIKPGTTKCYVIYEIEDDTIIIKYIKPCSQAYDY